MISVIIPSYNRSSTIGASVQSVLQQTYTDIEVIVVDDGSVDSTEAIVKAINDKRLRYVYQENAGACVARNKGVELARGDIIAFHDSDDIWHEDKLEKQIKKLKVSQADVIFCKLNQIENRKLISQLPSQIGEGFVEPHVSLAGIGTQTILGKKEVFVNEKFRNDMPRLQDLELMIRITRKYKVYCVNEGLVDYYIGEDSISSNPEKFFIACNKILTIYPDLEDTNPELINDLVGMMKGSLKKYILDGGKDYIKYSNWILQHKLSAKNLVFYLLSITRIYPIILKSIIQTNDLS